MRVAILAEFPLHCIPAFGEEFRPRGHYATWLPQLVEAYADFADLEAHWIVLSPLLDASRQVRWMNQTFHVIPTGRKFRAGTFFAQDRKAISACIAAIQPQLVHGWGTEDVYALAAATSGLPNIVSMQGILSNYVLRNRVAPRVYFQALLELYALNKADCITVESSWGREIIRLRSPRTPVHLIEYGTQSHFHSIGWQPDPQKPAALFAGSVCRHKGIQDAVAIFRRPELAHAELWIAGDAGNSFGRKLQRDASPNVKWLGRRTPAELAELYSHAWCFILPTLADTSPNVVKEARVIGLPVISTPCGGQTTYIEDGRHGFLVAPGDIDALARSTAQLLGSLEKCRAMGACDHEKQRQLLQPAKTAALFRSLYRERIDGRALAPSGKAREN